MAKKRTVVERKVKVDDPQTLIWRLANDSKGVDVTRAPVAEMTEV